MTARKKTRPRVPGVTDATTRATWKPVAARAHHGRLVRSLRPSLKHLIVPLEAELPRGPQRLRARRRIISKAPAVIEDQFRAIGLELPQLVQATRGLSRRLAVLRALAELTDRHSGPHDYGARGLGAWIQQILEETGPEPPEPLRARRIPRRGLEVLAGGRT